MWRYIPTLLICVFAGFSARAEDLKFITINVAPWASAGAPMQGVFPDVVRELERRTGHRIAMDLEPFARIDRELEAGTHDCTIVVWNPANARFARRGETVSHHPVGIIAAKGVRLADYESLYGLKAVSVLRGLAMHPRFDADLKVNKEFDTDYETGLRKLAHGRVDAVAGAVPTILYLAHQLDLDARLGDRLDLGTIDLALQCSLKSPHLGAMEGIDRAIREMRQDGTLDRILKEHYFL